MEDLADDSNLVWQDVDCSDLQKFVFNFDKSCIQAEFYDLYENEPYDFIKIFLTNEIIPYLLYQVNLYSTLKSAKAGNAKKSKSKAWISTSAQELEMFFAVIIWMSLLTAPLLRDY